MRRRGPGRPIQAVISNSKVEFSCFPIAASTESTSDRKPVCTWNNKWFGHQEAYKTAAFHKDLRLQLFALYTTPPLLLFMPQKLKWRWRHCAACFYIPVEDGAVPVGSKGAPWRGKKLLRRRYPEWTVMAGLAADP